MLLARLARRLLGQVVHVIDHGDEQVEEQLAAMLHLILHGTAALECVSSANDKRKVVSPQLRVAVRCVRIGKACRRQDGRALNTRLHPLLPQCELLQLLKPVLLSLAVDHGVLEDRAGNGVDDCLASAVAVAAVLDAPTLALGIVFEAGVVVAFVEVFEDGGEDFGVFLREVDAFVGAGEELILAGGLEEGRVAENVFVSREETLLMSDRECDDGADETACQ